MPCRIRISSRCSLGSAAARICSFSITTVVNFFQSACALSCWNLCCTVKDLSSSHQNAALGRRIDLSCTGRNWWKSPRKTMTGIPPKSCALPLSIQSCSFTSYNVRAPSMLTSSMMSMSLSCQSIVTRLSTRRPPVLGAVNCSNPPLKPDRDLSLEKLHAEWIVIPLILAAAVPDVVVTSSRCDIPLLANNLTRASMIRDFPVPPSPPMNSHSCGCPRSLRCTRSRWRHSSLRAMLCLSFSTNKGLPAWLSQYLHPRLRQRPRSLKFHLTPSTSFPAFLF
ncbi:hypothetical protein BKA66DRAFT_214024 [Pyrenochaeta sp. MPI-SDFR-AT-0127]|nr:hypothetical protein BKA66DRAFT_214024 [Pyrenochaeta sp. MPI-SDFR-AT-0127]